MAALVILIMWAVTTKVRVNAGKRVLSNRSPNPMSSWMFDSDGNNGFNTANIKINV